MEKKTTENTKIEEYILAVLFGAMVLITSVNIFTRYLMSYTFSWAEQVTRILFVWITMTGVSLAALKGKHLKVTALTMILPKKAGKAVLFIGNIISAVFGIVIAYYIFDLILNMIKFPQSFSAMPWLPVWVMYIPGVVFMVGFVIRLLQGEIIPEIKELMKGEEE